jgi:NDP-sugar pyrophosphorylase family protein
MSSDVQAVLQTGGRGERLRPATDTTPKALLPVGGVPMVERLLRQITCCGVRRVTIITGWLGDQVETYLRATAGLAAGVELNYVREERPVGNVGSLAQVDAGGRRILFAFGDLVTDLSFERLLAIHDERGADITLTSHYETHRVKLGEIVVANDEVVDYLEKPEKRFLICSGIAVFEPHALRVIDPATPTGIANLVRAAIARGLRVTHWLHGAFWMDVNSPEDLVTANTAVETRRHVR